MATTESWPRHYRKYRNTAEHTPTCGWGLTRRWTWCDVEGAGELGGGRRPRRRVVLVRLLHELRGLLHRRARVRVPGDERLRRVRRFEGVVDLLLYRRRTYASSTFSQVSTQPDMY